MKATLFAIGLLLVCVWVVPSMALDVDFDDLFESVEKATDDPRHESQLGDLIFSTGSGAEKAALVTAFASIRERFLNESLWRDGLSPDDSAAAEADFNRVRERFVAAIDRSMADIQAENADPMSDEFSKRWSTQPRFSENEDDLTFFLTSADGEISLEAFETMAVAKHFLFAGLSAHKVWLAFINPVRQQQAVRDLTRLHLWQSFNDIAYSLYPWEQWINGNRLAFGDLNKIPSWLVIALHPSVGVEVSQWDMQARVGTAFMVEVVGVQWLARSGTGVDQKYSRSYGLSGVVVLADDRDVGYGGMLHIGKAVHVGVIYRDNPPPSYEQYTTVISLDFYRLVAKAVPLAK